METQEEWRPVVGYESLYEVSNLGRVKSLPRKWAKGGILKPTPAKKGGYMYIDLRKNGKRELCKVHQLVMRAFVGECPDGHEVDHYDWNPSNNRLDNLSYQPKEVNRARKSPEGLQNISEAAKKRSKNPEWQRKNAEGAKKRSQDPEWRRKNAEAAKRRAQDPEWKKKHAEATRKACCKPVDQFTLDEIFVKSWESASDAARELGLCQSCISECCRGNQHTAGGFVWRYAVCST